MDDSNDNVRELVQGLNITTVWLTIVCTAKFTLSILIIIN